MTKVNTELCIYAFVSEFCNYGIKKMKRRGKYLLWVQDLQGAQNKKL